MLFKYNNSTPLEAPLGGDELLGGVRAINALSNYVALRDGRTYEITIKGTDFAGNESEPLSVTNITYDTTPAEIIISSPLSDSFVNTVDITFSTNEPLTNGKMTWVGENVNPMIFNLKQADLSEGQQILAGYGIQPEEKVYYQIFIEGIDRASNVSISDTIKNVTFDITPPEFAIIKPIDNTPVNSTELSYSISEPISNGMITWSAIGNGDISSPHKREIVDEQKRGGTFRNFIFPN